MDKEEKMERVRSFLEMPDGREQVREYGLEDMFDKEIQRLRNKLPKVTFRELSVLGFDALAKQQPITYEQIREQVLRVSNQTRSKNKKGKC